MSDRKATQGPEPRGRRWFRGVSGAAAALAAAPPAVQQGGPTFEQPDYLLYRWAGVLLVFVLIWFILYKVVYPFFLRYYRDDFCKTVFWNLFLLYAGTWLFLASYLLLEFGFYVGWMQWIAVFLAAMWLISGLVLLMQRKPV
jgi:hypothetical protein